MEKVSRWECLEPMILKNVDEKKNQDESGKPGNQKNWLPSCCVDIIISLITITYWRKVTK
jgi:hypothetical protein